jgi:hypothetical protein
MDSIVSEGAEEKLRILVQGEIGETMELIVLGNVFIPFRAPALAMPRFTGMRSSILCELGREEGDR